MDDTQRNKNRGSKTNESKMSGNRADNHKSRNNNDNNNAVALCDVLREHKGGDVTLIDLRELSIWTDFFIIATTTSSAHQSGLERHIKEYAQEHGIEILRRGRRRNASDEWQLIDLGNIVIHLMTEQARSFYELERLWSMGKASRA
jgi:ribosome-associated protein